MPSKPLFRDPTEGDERADPYDGPFGFLLGVFGSFERDELADQYLRGANLLVKAIREREVADFEIAYPILFLYRHAIEVLLKAIIGGQSNHHRLDALAGDLKKFAQRKYTETVPDWIINGIRELARIDPTSQAFRYGEDQYGKGKERQPIPAETYVRVLELHDLMNRLYGALQNAKQVMNVRDSEQGPL